MRIKPFLGACAALIFAQTAWADDQTCTQSRSSVSLERRLRQVYLDLLGRPPTLEEYRFTQMKGDILEDDLAELMSREAFYGRLKNYHRALLRANISASINNNGDTRLQVSTDLLRPLELRGNPSRPLRGRNGTGCDHFILQDSCNAVSEDPHLEPATKRCRDERGVPLPVSVNYNPDNYSCSQITIPAGAGAGCYGAIDGGTVANPDGGARIAVQDKELYYCDGRRELADGGMRYYLCRPNGTLVNQGLTEEVLDDDGRIVAYRNPAPPSGATSRLDRCTLNLVETNGVRGRYAFQNGCVQREGVVMTQAPHWDLANTASNTQVAMCAIEAQANVVNPWTMEACDSRFASDRTCGCGVASRRCEANTGLMHTQRVAAVNEEPLQVIDSVIRRDESYFNVLTTRRSFVNGPLSQLYREAQSPTVWVATSPTRRDLVPDVPLDQTDTWVEYTRDEYASGVLTTAAWLYRFPTQRARVSQFWDVFLCKHFAPPAGAVVPPPEDSCNRDNNLATRCGCSYCHATIEPVGAHWGRFGERNAQYLDPNLFPKVSAKCRDCALAGNTSCDNECGNYVMQAFDGEGASSLGLLRTYLYRTNDEEPNIVGGPKLLVERMLQTGDLERCAVRNAWNHLLGRPMTTEEEKLYLPALVDAFAMSNHNLKHLMVQIVSTDAYRRVD